MLVYFLEIETHLGGITWMTPEAQLSQFLVYISFPTLQKAFQIIVPRSLLQKPDVYLPLTTKTSLPTKSILEGEIWSLLSPNPVTARNAVAAWASQAGSRQTPERQLTSPALDSHQERPRGARTPQKWGLCPTPQEGDLCCQSWKSLWPSELSGKALL